MERAACMNHDHLDWFDIDCNLQQLLPVCAACPVISECLDYAHTNEIDTGVWGGMWGYRLQEQEGVPDGR